MVRTMMAGKGKRTPRTMEMLRPVIARTQKTLRDIRRRFGSSMPGRGSVTTGLRGPAGMAGSLIGAAGGDSFTGDEARS